MNDLDVRLAGLADPTRRRILELLSDAPRTASEIHQSFSIAGPAVSRHLRVLREAGLVEQKGVVTDKRVRVYALAKQPLEELAQWLERVSAGWQGQLDAFADYVALRREQPVEDSAHADREVGALVEDPS